MEIPPEDATLISLIAELAVSDDAKNNLSRMTKIINRLTNDDAIIIAKSILHILFFNHHADTTYGIIAQSYWDWAKKRIQRKPTV